ncbi:alpha-L-rhamnosidase [Stigmatella sp. ncwal1]|uniref:Alpha-L-rhamnosidase n=1 Tax=Stigmatella ashevillensis TaxID=2995309 RepID=A0ABT5DBR5_9BACT|nr:alpha-L-rhamnosidase [Stigmatella ashevillena]MDC0710555.1 alpha-L-rhamnosidase [Stigmatella ashevillena]
MTMHEYPPIRQSVIGFRRCRARATVLWGLAVLVTTAVPSGALARTSPDSYSPTSRTVAPVRVYSTSGSVSSPQNVLSGAPTRLSGANAQVVYDFGKEVGGLVTLSFSGASGAGQQLGLAFSESSLYIGKDSDLSNGGASPDGALYANVSGAGTYTMPTDKLRGGFRYLTLFLTTSGWVDLNGISLNFTPAPGKSNPQDYANYFSSNDPLLNKIWYAGAYTVQMNTIASNQGRVWGPPSTGWQNNATVGVGSSVLVDGAKRDRTVWAGDLGIALPTQYVSTNDTVSTRNAIAMLFQYQRPSGELQWGGSPFNLWGSTTYTMWALLGTASYYTYSGDKAWLDSIWSKYKVTMNFVLSQVGGNGLLSIPKTYREDWARQYPEGENIEANAILYATLIGGAQLAEAENDATSASAWRNRAAALKSAANAQLWNPAIGLYRDNPTSTLYPQDGNSLAVWYKLTDSTQKDASIVRALTARWNHIGALTPEKNDGGKIGTFPGSMELQAHLTAGDDVNALILMRREWGHMLNSPIGTASTFWEGMDYHGSLDPAYGGSFVSAAHGWATGPTFALTFSVLGLMPLAPDGRYHFIPHPGDLTHVEGSITLPQGLVSGSWDASAPSGTFSARLTSPAGTSGTVGIPTYGSSSVSVSVNGTTAWSGGAFKGAPGISGGSADGRYIYLTGVAPGSYTFTASGVVAPAPFTVSVLPHQLPVGYTVCAAEGGTCTPSGTQVLAYGAGSYAYRLISGPTACTTASFGGTDPAYNLLKSCYLAPAGGPAGFTACAAEKGTCSFSGMRQVAYGNNGAFRFRIANGSIACTNEAFGTDPLPNVAKSCYLAPADAPPSGNWSRCAIEGNSCTVPSGQPLAFGANGAFWSGTSSGTTVCNSGSFGVDPLFGTAKACYVPTGAPTGFGTLCSAEQGTCAFSGQKTVAYGANGAFLYKTFTGGTPCTAAAFGGADPLYGVAKSCYLP